MLVLKHWFVLSVCLQPRGLWKKRYVYETWGRVTNISRTTASKAASGRKESISICKPVVVELGNQLVIDSRYIDIIGYIHFLAQSENGKILLVTARLRNRMLDSPHSQVFYEQFGIPDTITTSYLKTYLNRSYTKSRNSNRKIHYFIVIFESV